MPCFRENELPPNATGTSEQFHRRVPDASPHVRIKAVLIEDNMLIREGLISALEELGGITISNIAEDESAAIAILAKSADWHLAILDLYLKKGNGLKVLHATENRQPHQKIVVLSNYVTPEIRTECIALGANAVFDKSTELAELLEYCKSQV